MFSIHPSHLEIINQLFSITQSEFESAKKIVDAFEESKKMGRGSTSLDGKMIDIPVYKRNLKVVQQYQNQIN